jgi:hypothetical protein
MLGRFDGVLAGGIEATRGSLGVTSIENEGAFARIGAIDGSEP